MTGPNAVFLGEVQNTKFVKILQNSFMRLSNKQVDQNCDWSKIIALEPFWGLGMSQLQQILPAEV